MSALVSWACPTRLGDAGKVDKPGCGGNWGAVLPSRCPSCALIVTQRLVEMPLTPFMEVGNQK